MSIDSDYEMIDRESDALTSALYDMIAAQPYDEISQFVSLVALATTAVMVIRQLDRGRDEENVEMFIGMVRSGMRVADR